MRNQIYNILALFMLVIGLVSCVDDRLYDPDEIGEGEASISADVTFSPLSEALASRAAGGTQGDAIMKISNLNVIVYTESGKFVGIYPISDSKITTSENTGMPDDAMADYGHQAETKTTKASFSLSGIPYGKYRMYAVANVDSKLLAQDKIATESDLKNISVQWDKDNIGANSQMFGYFTPENTKKSSGFEAPTMVINRPNVKMHSWIKRLASKVTIAFDARKLKENITIYLKSATIKDIPANCFLGKDNTPDAINQLIATGQSIDYTDNPGSTTYDKNWDAAISSGRPIYGFNTTALGTGSYNEQIAAQHGENVNALFFYENMQGQGEHGTESDKSQVVDDGHSGNKPSYPNGNDKDNSAYKDAKKYGTYIEVTAHYQSNNTNDMTSGDIIYRFMLGKDTHLDFDAQRNHHYKLTMHFNGYANDVDWHIEYEREPGMKIPNPYYISYLYNHSMMLPLQIDTEPGVSVTGLKAEIIENGWAPADPTGLTYWYPMDKPATYPWNGFLSLHKTTDLVITKAKPWNLDANKEYYNKSPKRGERVYMENEHDIQDGEHSTGNGALASDVYNVTVENDKSGNTYKFQLPMYTRAKQLIKATAYTGNNPFVAYQREAKVKITATLSDNNTYEDIVTIKQAQRVVNPKGIWRSATNNSPFHVVLKILPNEDSENFRPLESDGPWKAYVIKGDIVSLTGDSETTTTKKETITYQAIEGKPIENINVTSVYGKTGSNIDFNINFKAGEGDAIIRVEYNNFSCYHLIFIKKGDKPVQLVNGGARWYTANMRDGGHLAANPLDEGSLFKWNNWTGIDALKNKNNRSPWINVEPKDFVGNAAAPGNKLTKAEWDAIVATSNQTTTTFQKPSLANTDIANYNDYIALYKSEEIAQGYGVLYGDESNETLDNITQVYGYDYKNKTGGMRGCFVYNKVNGKNLFFPIGASGYGHRRETLRRPNSTVTVNWNAGPTSGINPVNPPSNDALNDDNSTLYWGVLRYSCNNRWGYFNVPWGHVAYPQSINDAPLFFDLFMRPGAIYWIKSVVDGKTAADTQHQELNDADLDRTAGWDFNYFTFDFFPIGETNMNNGYDAVFIRCVQR